MIKKLLCIVPVKQTDALAAVALEAGHSATPQASLSESEGQAKATHAWANWGSLSLHDQKKLSMAIMDAGIEARCIDTTSVSPNEVLQALGMYRVMPKKGGAAAKVEDPKSRKSKTAVKKEASDGGGEDG